MKAAGPVETASVTDWRTLPPLQFRQRIDSILALALRLTAFDADDKRRLLTASAQGDANALLAVADLLGQKGRDLTWTWVALAAIHGSEVACLQVAAELLLRAEKTIKRVEANRSRHLAGEWARSIARDLTSLGDYRADMFKKFASAGMPGIQEEIGDDDEHEGTEARLGPFHGPSMVVSPPIPLLRGDRDDKALVSAWEILTKPLPLASGPPSRLLRTVLQMEFPWAREAVDAVVGDLEFRERIGLGWSQVRPTLLVGPPGTGKTRFARRLADLLGTGYGEISGAGSSDNRLLQGTARGWGTTQPSYVLQVMRASRTANPVIVVDELDKTHSDGRNGDIRQTLLAMLEPTTAKAWLDECLAVPVNLSAVSWVLTANDTFRFRGPLMTRLRAVEVPLPRPEHLDAVLVAVRRDLAAEFGVRDGDLPPIQKDADAAIRRAFRNGIGLRHVRAAYERALHCADRLPPH